MQRNLYAKEDRHRRSMREGVDIPFLLLLLLLLAVGLGMLYSASFAQSHYDTGYTQSTRYLQKQGLCALIGLGCPADKTLKLYNLLQNGRDMRSVCMILLRGKDSIPI